MTKKKRTLQQILSIAFVVVMVMSLLPVTGMTALAAEAVSYIDRSWDGSKVVDTTKSVSDYTVVTSDTTTMTNGWYVVNSSVTVAERITVTGEVHLILVDGAHLTASQGIAVNDGNALHIYGQSADESTMGKLTATNAGWNAAIGGNNKKHCGSIEIDGGIITATSRNFCAVIGGGYKGNGGNIEINGGSITVTTPSDGATIGGGEYGSGGNIEINGGDINATVSNGGAAIGGGKYGSGGNIEINGGDINATASNGGAAIGGGEYGSGGNILVTGGTVMAKNTNNQSSGGSGIGGGYKASGGTTVITGGTVMATGGWGAAAIGGYANAGTIVITGGEVTANGNVRAAVIGGGVSGGSAGSIAILTDSVTVNKHTSSVRDIGAGEKGGTMAVMRMDGDTINVTGNYSLPIDYTLPEGKTLVIPEGATLTIPEGKTFINNGTITNHGKFVINKLFKNNGTITGSGTMDCTQHNISVAWTSVQKDGGYQHYRTCLNGCGSIFEEADCSGGEPTCLSPGYCAVCGGEYLAIDKEKHATDETYYQYTDEKTHSQYHSCCGALIGTKAHTEGTAATCMGIAHCDVCDASYGSTDADNHADEGELIWEDTGYNKHRQKWSCCGALTGVEAEHNLTYTADEDTDTITVSCNTCGGSGTVTLTDTKTEDTAGSDAVKTYDGYVYEASETATGFMNGWFPVASAAIGYCCEGGCSDAGEHTVTMTVGTASVSKTFTIAKRELGISKIAAFNKSYDATAAVDVNTVRLNGVVVYSEGEYKNMEFDDVKDDVSVVSDAVTVVTSDSIPGEYLIASITGIRLAGEDAGNYTIEESMESVPLDDESVADNYMISKASLIITPEDQALEGDETLNPDAYTVEGCVEQGEVTGITLYEDTNSGKICVDTDGLKVTLNGVDVTAYHEVGFAGKANISRVCSGHTFDDNGFCSTGNCNSYESAEKNDNGTSDDEYDDYYEIWNAGQLYWFAEQVNSYEQREISAVLMDDIVVNTTLDENARAWKPINNYYATFDGNGKTVSGLHCVVENGYAGFFGSTGYYPVINLHISNSYFEGVNAGAIAGYHGGSDISNCSADTTVTVKGTSDAGGLVGNAGGGMMTTCYSHAVVSGSGAVGGLVGYSCTAISNCYTTAGTLVGTNSSSYGGSITNSYYLAEAETTDNEDGSIGKTADQFASGEVAYLLQSGVKGEVIDYDDNGNPIYGEAPHVWGQNVDGTGTKDVYPVRGGATVYCGYASCNETALQVYTNDANKVSEERPEHSSTAEDDKAATCKTLAYCSVCKKDYGEVNPDNHSITADGDMAATCKSKAYCSACGSAYGELDAKNHANEPTYKVNENNSSMHDVSYTCCNAPATTEAHIGGSISAKDTILTDTCTKCGAEAGTATISATGKTYDGTAVVANVEATGSLMDRVAKGDLPITYCCTDSCKDAGNHTASITLGEHTASVQFTISKAIPVVTAPVATPDLTYNGEAQALVTAGKTTGGEMQYSMLEYGTYGTYIPVGSDVGDYTVWYKVVGDKNYESVAAKSVNVSLVAKKITELTFDGLNKAYAYTGNAIEPAFTVKDGETKLTRDKDYTVAFENNTELGTATIRVTLQGNYSGEVTATFEIKNHVHQWKYELNETGDTINVTCIETVGTCDAVNKSITIVAPGGNMVYDGKVRMATLTGSIDDVTVSADDITYCCENGCKVAKTHTASITLGEGDDAVTAKVDFAIEKAQLTVTGTTAKSRDYNETNTVEITDVALEGIVDADDVKVKLDGVQGTLSSADVGTYELITLPQTLELTGADAGNYTLVQPTGAVKTSVTINKLNPTITVGTETYEKTFGDAEFDLGVKEDNPEKDVTYASSNEDVVTISDGTVSIQGAGTATITVSLDASTNYNAAESKTITVNVDKATHKECVIDKSYCYLNDYDESIDLTAYLPENCGTVTYGNPTVSEGNSVNFVDSPSVTDGKLTYQVEKLPAYDNDKTGTITVNVSTANYEDFTITVNVRQIDQLAVKVKEGSEVTLKNNTLTYGEALSKLELNSAEFVDADGKEVEGTLAWKEPSATPDAGTASAAWAFTPADNTYAAVEGVSKITVNKAVPTVVTVPSVENFTYDLAKTLGHMSLEGGSVTGVDKKVLQGTWSWEDSAIIPSVDKSEYVAVFTPDDSTNYETVKETITITVTKATPYVEVTPLTESITYGAVLGDYALVNGSARCKSEMVGSIGVEGEFVWKNPETKPVVADSNTTEYEVVFIPADTVNYNTIETAIKVLVRKAENTPGMPESAMSALFSQKTVKDVELPEGWIWNEADSARELMVGAAVEATAIYNGDDKGNYATESVTISITRQACEHAGGTASCTEKAVCDTCGEPYGAVDPANHIGGTEVRGAKDATCGAEGYTGDTYCKDCGEKTAAGKTVDKKPHTYGEPVFNWSEDGKSCTLIFTCTNDASHKETKDATVTSEVKAAATCKDMGTTTYAATYTDTDKVYNAEGKTYTETKDVVDIPVTENHTGGTATCTQKAVCSICGNEYGTEDSSKHGETEVKDAKDATCGAEGYTGDTYCKDCGAKTGTGEVVEKLTTHTWDEGVVTKEATTTETGVKTFTCTVCGDTNTEEIPMISGSGDNTPPAEDKPGSGEDTPPAEDKPGSGEDTPPAEDNPGSGEDTPPAEDNPGSGEDTTPPAEDKPGSGEDITPPANLPGTDYATVTATEKKITSANTDKADVAGSTFAKLRLKATGKNRSVKLTWKKVKNADGYILYGAKCGNKLKKIKTFTKASTVKYTQKKLKKGTYYKYMVVAYKNIDGQKYIIASSKSAHAVTKGGKYANPAKVTVKASKITVKKGKSKTIKASYKIAKGKKCKTHIAKLRYESSNKKIATVNRKGKVTGKKKGTCYIYVYAQNGVYKKVKVTVK